MNPPAECDSCTTPAVSHWSHRVFALRERLDLRIDGRFAASELDPPPRVLLFNETDAGLGDAAFMHKAARALRDGVPGIEMRIVATEPAKHEVFGAIDGVPVVSIEAQVGDRGPWARPELVLSGPGIFDNSRLAGPVLARLGLPADLPFLYLAEYGSLRQLRADAFGPLGAAIDLHVERCLDAAAARAGVEPEGVGHRGRSGEILAVRGGGPVAVGSLVADFLADSPPNPLRGWLFEPRVRARSAGLEPGELGVHVSHAPSARGISDAPASAFVARAEAGGGRVFVGYGHGGHGVFLAYAVHLALSRRAPNSEARRGGAGAPIDVLLPTRRSADRALADFIDARTAALLARAGVGRVELTGNATDDASGGPTATLTRDLGPGVPLRVLCRYPLPHSDFLAILEHAQPAVMVSGDQSFSDALAARRVPVVIEPMYCRTWALDAQLALAERFSSDYAAVLRFAMAARWDADRWPEVRAKLADPAVMASGAAMIDHIRAEHDLAPRLVAMVRRAVAVLRDPEVAARVRRELKEGLSRWAC